MVKLIRPLSVLTAVLGVGAVFAGDADKQVYNDIDVSAGGDITEPVAVHRAPYAAWLADPNYNNWTNYTTSGYHYEWPQIIRLTWGDVGRTLEFTNLTPGVTYEYSVVKNDSTPISGSFTTVANPPRWLAAEVNHKKGSDASYISNFRDLGGWEIPGGNGKKTNFNVFFRSASLDSYWQGSVDYRARCPIHTEFGIKTELDLRTASETGITSVAPEDPKDFDNYVYYFDNATKAGPYPTGSANTFTSSPMVADDSIRYYLISMTTGVQSSLTSDYAEATRKCFQVLGNPANHPVLFHCAGGRDRTGFVAVMIEALCGLTEEQIFRDHLSIVFAAQGSMYAERVDGNLRSLYANGSDGQPLYAKYGPSLAGHARAYLEAIGVTYDQLKGVTQAYVGETPEEVLARVDAYEASKNMRTVYYVTAETRATNAVHRVGDGEMLHDPVLFPRANETTEANKADGLISSYKLSREGFRFTGWTEEAQLSPTTGVKYSQWAVQPIYSVTFKGPFGEVLAAGAVNEGESGAALVPSAPAGTEITGWSADLAELDAVGSNMVFTATMIGTGSGYVGTVGEAVTDPVVLMRGGDVVRKLTTANGGTEYVHVFTDSSRAVTFANPLVGDLQVTYFAVGGGGAGGNSHPGSSSTDRFGAGGGGGGGVASSTYTIPGGKTLTITVGKGGTVADSYSAARGPAGATTIFCDGVEVVTAPGGGAGGSDSSSKAAAYPQPGAAGGGAAYYETSSAYGQGAAGTFASYAEGRNYPMNGGGKGSKSIIGNTSCQSLPGGGGGAGGAGRAGVSKSHVAGNGGLGVYASITGDLALYGAGGGGGGGAQGTYLESLAAVGYVDGIIPGEGANGGGRGGAWSATLNAAVAPQAGAANTGAGGGGAGANSQNAAPGADGVVIIRYLEQPANSPAIGGVISSWESAAGTEYLHRFDNIQQLSEFRNVSGEDLTVRYLVVGGGGAGGASYGYEGYSYGGGGGGGGGVAGASAIIPADGVWTIAVGKGGIASNHRYYTAEPGTASAISNGVVEIAFAPAGGAGGNTSNTSSGRTGGYAIAGATGGGDSERGTAVMGTFQSYSDGITYGPYAGGKHAGGEKFISDDFTKTNKVNYSGGGAGAGGNGVNGNSSTHVNGAGGVGVPSDITGVMVRYGGGGGGGTSMNGPLPLTKGTYGDGEPGAGTDGGGTGGYYDEANEVWVEPAAGTDGLGGGGGGASLYHGKKATPGCSDSTVMGANGGNGVVYIRYTANPKNPTPDFATTGNVGQVVFDFSGESVMLGGKIYVMPGTTATVKATDLGGRVCSCWRDESTGEIFWGSEVELSPTDATMYTAVFGANWEYDASAGTLSDGEWIFTARTSGTTGEGIILSNCVQAASHGFLNLAAPVVPAAGTSLSEAKRKITRLGHNSGSDGLFARSSNEIRQQLKGLVLPDNNFTICRRAFYACSNLTGVVCFPGETTFYRENFYGCTSLEGIVFKGGVTGGQKRGSDSYGLFNNCKSLGGDLELPAVGFAALQQYDFKGTAITSANLTNVTTIGKEAFNGCKQLASVRLSDSLVSIGAKAFLECRALADVDPFLPDSVETVDTQAFQQCAVSGELRLKSVKNITYQSFYSDSTEMITGLYAPSATNVSANAFKSYNLASVEFGPAKVSFLYGNGTAANYKIGYANFNRLADKCVFTFPGLAPDMPQMSVVGGQGCFGTYRPFYKDKHPVFIGDWSADPEGWNKILDEIGSTDIGGKTPPTLPEGYTVKGLFHFLGDAADNVQYGWLVAMPGAPVKRPFTIYVR